VAKRSIPSNAPDRNSPLVIYRSADRLGPSAMMERVSGKTARSVYAFEVVDAAAPDRHDALFKSVVVSLLSLNTGHWEVFPAKVMIHIVDRRTDEIVWTRQCEPEVARLFAIDIDKDLDRMGPAAFAVEWSITPSG
jgi:hypothetical protein